MTINNNKLAKQISGGTKKYPSGAAKRKIQKHLKMASDEIYSFKAIDTGGLQMPEEHKEQAREFIRNHRFKNTR